MLKLLRENIRTALGSIRSQLLRTILTIVIIGIGIWALVGILASVAALQATMNANFADMGSNTFSITQYDWSEQLEDESEREENPAISYPQAKAFKERYDFPQSTVSLAFQATAKAEVRYESKKTDPNIQVWGVDENFLSNTGSETTLGRNFTNFDITNNASVCIVGSDFIKGLLKDIDPIDKVISVRGARFRVIGVLKEKGATFGNNQDLRVMIPIQRARSLFSASGINYTISVKVERGDVIDAAVDHATLAMKNIRRVGPAKKPNFGIERSDDLLHRIAEVTDYLKYAAIVISIITILGSSIALMNIMVVSVTERTREIGVRKALGAKKRTIATQFFIETVVIGQLGGLLGIILGLLTEWLISASFNLEFVVPWTAGMWAIVVSFIVALVSGLFPAIKAANLDPIEALRYE